MGIPTDTQDGGTGTATSTTALATRAAMDTLEADMDTLEADIQSTGTDRTVIMTVESGFPRHILGCGSGTKREH